MRKAPWHALPYLAGFLLPPHVVGCISEGGWWTFMPVVTVFVAGPIVDALSGTSDEARPPADVDANFWFRIVTWAWAPVQLGLLLRVLTMATSGRLCPLEIAGATLPRRMVARQSDAAVWRHSDRPLGGAPADLRRNRRRGLRGTGRRRILAARGDQLHRALRAHAARNRTGRIRTYRAAAFVGFVLPRQQLDAHQPGAAFRSPLRGVEAVPVARAPGPSPAASCRLRRDVPAGAHSTALVPRDESTGDG